MERTYEKKYKKFIIEVTGDIMCYEMVIKRPDGTEQERSEFTYETRSEAFEEAEAIIDLFYIP